MKRLLFLALLSIGCVSAYAQKEISVRTAGEQGVHTYRIPGLATTKSGTLLAVYDMRNTGSRDLQGDIDIGLARSTDRGATWEPNRTILDMGQWGGLPQKFNGVSDPCILVDQKSGRIWVTALWMHGVLDGNGKWIEGLNEQSTQWNHQWVGRASQPGLSPRQTTQMIMTYSDDDGITWSKPINVTEQFKRPEWWLAAPAPGAGITMKDGTLVLPTQGRDSTGLQFSNISYSGDGGKTWTMSNPAYTLTTECAVVELSDGSIMLNMRDDRNRSNKGEDNGRAVFTTRDMGQTWTEHPSSHGALIEPVCMASLHKHGKYLLFSNPSTVDKRSNIRLKVSKDNGMTWNKGVLLDSGDSFGYSCLTSLDRKTIGVLWEGSRAQMAFRAIPLKEILEAE